MTEEHGRKETYMGIAGIGSNSFNYYGMQYLKNNQAKNCGTPNDTTNVESSNHVVHGDNDKFGKEWNKLIEKMDKDINAIKSEQEERKTNQQAEKVSDDEDTVLRGTKTAFGADTYSYFKTDGMTVCTKDGTPLAEKALTDQRYTDKKTGISWYVGEDGKPYMVEDDVDKFNEMCRENGEFPLKKFAEMTGMIQQLDDNTTAFVGDNGIAVKGKDGSEYLLDIAGMSYDNIMNMLSQATGGGDYYSDKYWNNIKNHLYLIL